jgi:hypothetical protein
VSERTAVVRDQRSLGGRHLTAERVQKLSERQMANCLEWCKALLKKYPEDADFWKTAGEDIRFFLLFHDLLH